MAWDVDDIIQAAATASGSDRFQSDGFRDGLALLAFELGGMERLKPGASDRLRGAAVGFLINRLRLDAYVEAHPEVLDRPVDRPLFIIGMPRTGTTLLSNLLAQDPDRRSLLNWEAHGSTPPPTPDELHGGARVTARQALLEQGRAAFPAMAKVHAEDADSPTECLSLQKQDFKALWWDAMAPLPGYAEWILGCDMTSAYDYHRRALQVLQSRAPGAWTLKMPSHALHIDWLLKTYPDAQLVWTHRDPFRALASLCSLIRTAQSANLEPDIGFIAANYPRQAAEHLTRPLRVKRDLGDERIVDVIYADLVRDPLGEVRRLYERLGQVLSPEADAAMCRWLVANPQAKFGRHDYGLEQFGLSVEAVQPLFAEYLDRFELEREASDAA